MTKKCQYHTKEFRLSAGKMVIEEHIKANKVASRLGMNTTDLKRWIHSEKKKKTSRGQASLKERLLANKKQEEEIRHLKMEREILKKAIAYFMADQN